jgi:hypothetical protein
MKVAPDHAAGDPQERRKLSTPTWTPTRSAPTSIRVPFNIPAANVDRNVDKSLAEVIRPRNSLELRLILDSNQWPSGGAPRAKPGWARLSKRPASRSFARLAKLEAVLSSQRSQVSQPFHPQMWTNHVDSRGGWSMSLASARS